jgi:hypothetical protein
VSTTMKMDSLDSTLGLAMDKLVTPTSDWRFHGIRVKRLLRSSNSRPRPLNARGQAIGPCCLRT